jgi:hypothetical protein
MGFLHRDERSDGTAPGARVGLGVRSHVALHHAELDRDLAAGVNPASSPEHTVRARQLTGTHVRRELADCIDGVIARAEHPPHWHSTVLPIQAAAVHAACPDLEELRDALLDDSRSDCHGVALAAVLLHDHSGPLYTDAADTTVTALARAATTALAPGADGAAAGDALAG